MKQYSHNNYCILLKRKDRLKDELPPDALTKPVDISSINPAVI